MKRYSLGSSSITDLEKGYVRQVLDNNFISPGPVVAEVEKMCAALHKKKHCVTLNSGQSAIQVGLQALITEIAKAYPGRDFEAHPPVVAVPACTYISTLAAAIYAGCKLVLVDVEIHSGNMDADELSDVLNNYNVDIVVPVHLYGKACSSEVRKVCQVHKVLVLEDAAEATAVPGTGWGDVIITSFFSNHLISGGSGGAIMTDSDDVDLGCWKLINHGRASRFSNDDIHRIADKFWFDCWGHSLKWSDVNAAIVKAQLERINDLYAARRRNANQLWKYLWPLEADYGTVCLPEDTGHCYMMYPIVVLDESRDIQKIIHYINDHGIETRRMMPITNQPVVKSYFQEIDLAARYPNADFINRQGFYVGCHPELTSDDMDVMGTILREALEDV